MKLSAEREVARGGTHLNEPLWEPDRFERLLDPFGDERGLRRRFQEDRVTRDECRNESVHLNHVCGRAIGHERLVGQLKRKNGKI